MAVPSIIRCVTAVSFLNFAKVGDPLIIQGSGFIEPTVLVDSESASDITINSESASDITIDSEGF